MDLSTCKAIIFDSDGVLVDSEVIHIEVEREMLAELGLSYDREEYLSRFVGLSYPDFYSQLASDYQARIGGAFPADFGARLHERTEPRIEAELRPLGGVTQLVEAFSGKVAVGSSAPTDKLVKKLEITKLAELFAPHIYSVDAVSSGKPAPDLFLHAAKQIEVPPERCAVIEDSINGIRAARAAGMLPIGFVGGSHADQGLADRLFANGASLVVSSHHEIIGLL